ncbi:MAG TPA: hypothetical protein PKG63_03190 [Bacteroidales bacterium]|nr:hypothetical protein [Bacteroidales bacterium]HNV95454.1 hypothetical protein [Bacteroidales bacterium]HOU98856.1 hypothetical protein [Bacteroidales bacterium]
MKVLTVFLFISLIFTLFSCNSNNTDSDQNSYLGKASELLPWISSDAMREAKMENHPYVFFVDTTHEFSYGFKAKVKDLKNKSAKKITVSCDGYLYQVPSKVQLVIDIKNDGNNIFWQSQSFDKNIKEASTWGNVQLSVDLPKEINSNTEILVYVWSPSHEVGLFDNLKVKFE